uniref:Uncharacterized protein n=1 Tax=Anguilla anguilla TaxID=7936 RepID=A0A0E9UPU1_ANGAN
MFSERTRGVSSREQHAAQRHRNTKANATMQTAYKLAKCSPLFSFLNFY